MACIVVTNLCGAFLSSDASKIGPCVRGKSSLAPLTREDNRPNLTERSLDLPVDSQLASMSPQPQESTHRCAFARGPVSGLRRPSEC